SGQAAGDPLHPGDRWPQLGAVDDDPVRSGPVGRLGPARLGGRSVHATASDGRHVGAASPPSGRTTRAGFPATTTFGGTSEVTTARNPTTEFSPIRTPGRTA